jgi:peptidylprolyl isomerase
VVVRGVDGDEAGCIPDEHTEKISNSIGTLAMANNDAPNTGGSQFFINLSDNPELDWWTPGDSKHPVFGKVVGDGIDVVAKIGKVPTDEDERPSKPIKIKRIALD